MTRKPIQRMCYGPVDMNGNDFSRAADEFNKSAWDASKPRREIKRIAAFLPPHIAKKWGIGND